MVRFTMRFGLLQLLSIVFGVAQLVAAIQGYIYYIGIVWAVLLIAVSAFFYFPLVLSIGAFLGASAVWGWYWVWALLFAVPSLIFLVPEMMVALVNLFRRELR